MRKPLKVALGIGVASAACAGAAFLAAGPPRWLAVWTSGDCAVMAVAYAANRPGVFGKRAGRLSAWRALGLLPFLAAYRCACEIARRARRERAWDEVAPGIYVAARVRPRDLPWGLELLVDLTCEHSEPAPLRAHPGYRCVPVLDGSTPPDDEVFLSLLDEVREASGGVLFHCESGRGRAPTAAALALIARGIASDPAPALEIVRKGRPSAAPTRVDVEFIERIAARLRSPARSRGRG
jgi:hypothetical protein